jgi:hypothetical protein
LYDPLLDDGRCDFDVTNAVRIFGNMTLEESILICIINQS